jgi:hypothetical protein
MIVSRRCHMRYYVKQYVNEQITVDRTEIDVPLQLVKDTARNAVELGTADRVEVRDGHDALIYQWPRTLKPAA